jgi:maltose/moltooligosaccharide transporter
MRGAQALAPLAAPGTATGTATGAAAGDTTGAAAGTAPGDTTGATTGAATATAPADRYRAGTLSYSLLGLVGMAFWLLVGELGIAMRDRAALPSGLEMLRLNAASDTTTSLLMSTVPAVLSLLLLPFIGYHSDHFRSTWGRRRPFLMVIAPIGALALLGLAASPLLGRLTDDALGAISPGLRNCNLAFFCLFWTVFECATITTCALFTGLVNDVVPQGFLGRFYAVFRVLGLGVGIGFNMFLFALTDRYLSEILVVVGLVFGGALILMCLMVKEGVYPADAQHAHPGSLAVPRAHFMECFAQRTTLWAFAAFMLAGVTFSPFNTFCQYYAGLLGISKGALGTLTAYAYAISIALAFGIGWLVDRFSALRITFITMVLYCLVAAAGFVWLRDAASFRVVYVAHVVISGAYFTAAASLPMALFPRSQFVRYNATNGVICTFASIFVSAIQGPALDWSGHDYRLTLLSAAVFSLLCVGCLSRVRPTNQA